MAAGHKAPLVTFVALATACSLILANDLRGSAVTDGERAAQPPATSWSAGSAGPAVQPTPRAADDAPAAGVRRRPAAAPAAKPAAPGPASTPQAPEARTSSASPRIGVAITASRRTGVEPGNLTASGPVDLAGLAGSGLGFGVSAPQTADGAAPAPGGPKPGSVPTLDFAQLWSLPAPAPTPAQADDEPTGGAGDEPAEPVEPAITGDPAPVGEPAAP